MIIVDCPNVGSKIFLGPVRCPFYSEHERCRVARGTGPDLFARHYCDRTDGASWAWVRR